MSDADDLLTIANSVVVQAHAGEGLEVYVTRGTDTEVRAYEGEVESLTQADSSGVGIRVLVDTDDGNRVGFAWAGSLDREVIAATLSDARDNARFATPDPDVALAEPDGVSAIELDLWDDGVASTPMEKKVDLAVQLERATRGADPRVRQVSSADYSDSRTEVALASTTGISSSRRRTSAFLSVDAIVGTGDDTQTGTGFSVGRGPGELMPDEAMDEAVLRATRMLGAQKPPSGRCTVVFDPRVVSTLLGIVSSALSGEAVVKGRSFFAGRI
jgi:PmbA protein